MRISAEVCVHHLWFHDGDYERKGTLIKWNPAVKTKHDRDSLVAALLNDKIDVIVTDHAPARLFGVKERGFIEPGYKADLVLLDLEQEWTVTNKDLYYICSWSPLVGEVLHTKVTHTNKSPAIFSEDRTIYLCNYLTIKNMLF